ncbi:hypothetical protein Ancab_023027 [Ancistrocladus abbreviatus]
MGKGYPTVSGEYSKAGGKCKKKLRALFVVKNCTPIMLHLAWHSAGAKKGLEIAVRLLETIKEQFPVLLFDDFYQLEVLVVEVIEGPQFPFHPGTEGKPERSKEGSLPDATQGSWDIVAPSGGRPLARCRKERLTSDYQNLVFYHSYFNKLLSNEKEGLLQLPSNKALLSGDDAFFAGYAEAYLMLPGLGFAEALSVEESADWIC